ncbi:unnamed protein product [Dracunculus medinensis]|uniref:mRNA_decap_C domain-containing protein n=1 Tax=Dracunculus medinensis TaxID=318479 RepID=A0A0N4UFG8_DRAME|nr:unnamed protein product [Dracunculus medinensis]
MGKHWIAAINKMSFEVSSRSVDNLRWNIIKYTKLFPCRIEICSNIGQLFVVLNKSRRCLNVFNGSSVLEEFSLISIPKPIVKSRDQDLLFQVNKHNGVVLTRFRIKFMLTDEHINISNYISFFINIIPSKAFANDSFSNMSADFIHSQPISQDESFQVTQSGSFIIDNFSQPQYVNHLNEYNKECSNWQIAFPDNKSSEVMPTKNFAMAVEPLGVPLAAMKPSDQVVPVLIDPNLSLASTQSYDNDSMNNPSQFSLRYSQISNHINPSTEAETQTTNDSITIDDMLLREDLLEKILFLKLNEPKFIALVEKCTAIMDRIYTISY